MRLAIQQRPLTMTYRHAYTHVTTMSPKETTALRLNTDLLEAMRRVKQQDGVPVTTQIEMAVREWLEKRGALQKTDRKRKPRRSRP